MGGLLIYVEQLTELQRPQVIRQEFAASVFSDGDWYVAQTLDIDIVSQRMSVGDASANLREALGLHYEQPVATVFRRGRAK